MLCLEEVHICNVRAQALMTESPKLKVFECIYQNGLPRWFSVCDSPATFVAGDAIGLWDKCKWLWCHLPTYFYWDHVSEDTF